MGRVYLDTLVTLVDASTFIQDYASRWAAGTCRRAAGRGP